MRDTGASAWAARTRAIGWRRPVRPRSRALAIGAAQFGRVREPIGAAARFFFLVFFFLFFSMRENAAVRA